MAPETNIGVLLTHFHMLCKILIEGQAKVGHLDILGKAEQPADTAIGKRCCSTGVRGITLKHQHRAGTGQLAKMVGNA